MATCDFVNDPRWQKAVALTLRHFSAGQFGLDVPTNVTEAQALAEQDAGDYAVYFAQMVGTPYAVKIGYTRVDRLESRLANLSCGSPSALQLLKIMPGARVTEGLLHGRFQDYRLNGEWFEAAPELINFIGRGRVATIVPDLEFAGEPGTHPDEVLADLKVRTRRAA